MTCNQISIHPIQHLLPNNTIAQAAALMDLSSEDLLPVCWLDGTPVGVLTAHDIVARALARHWSPDLTRVDEVMTKPPLFVFAGTPVDVACEIMGDEGVTRLLVLDAAGHVGGIVRLNDALLNTSDELALATARRMAAGARFRTAPPLSTVQDRDTYLDTGSYATAANPARAEAELVLRGGTNELKEFP